MTETKHTPAPWFVVDVGSGASIHSSNFDVCRIDSYIVCSDSTEKQNKANAKLIAAAPELLAALIEIEKHTQDFVNAFSPDNEFTLWVNKARAAIAKATGE